MKTNVKPGDLAVIVSSFFPSNIGKIVSVVRAAEIAWAPLSPTGQVYFVRSTGDFFAAEGPGWIVECLGSPIETARDYTNERCFHYIRPFPDCLLRPLRDDEQQEETETTRELEHT